MSFPKVFFTFSTSFLMASFIAKAYAEDVQIEDLTISPIAMPTLGAPRPTLYAALATPQGTVPDAGRIMQEIERDLEVKPPQTAPEFEEVAPQPLPDADEPTVVIHHFKFQGNHVLTSEALAQVLNTLTNHEITITQLKTCTDLIGAYYREQGYMAIVTLPDQDITEGEVTVVITEAIFGGVKIDGTYGQDYRRVRPSVITRAMGLKALEGKPLNQDQLEAGVDKVEQLAGIKIQSALQAGQVEGTTDVLVKVQDQKFLTTYAAADNSGSRSTGREKLTGYLDLASPFGFGDRLSATLLHTRGTDYGRLAYNFPVAGTKLQLLANASYMSYSVISPEFKTLDISGYSSNFGLGVRYPLYKSKETKLDIEVDADKKFYVNKAFDATVDEVAKTSDYDVSVYSVALEAERIDRFLAGARNNASINFGRGLVDLDGSANQATDRKATDTQGKYSRIRWSISRDQFFTDSISLFLSAQGQIANRNLDSSEKFYLGGVSGVRAYPTSEGGGSEGMLAALELRKYLPYGVMMAAFIDYGHIKQYDNNRKQDGSAINDNNTYDLKGYGASLTWQGPYNTNLKATYARRMGDNPNKTNTGNDQDGSRIVDVFWLSGSVTF